MRSPFKISFPFILAFSFFLFLTSAMISCTRENENIKSKKASLGFNFREGKRLFLHYCSPCHGEDAQGTGRYFPSQMEPPPTDFVNTEYFRETAETVIFKAIKFGSSALGKSNYSPLYKNTLRDEEIEFIIEYLRSLEKMSEEEPSDSK